MKKREQLFKYKGNRCSVCGMSVIEMVSRFGTFERMLEFHHINPNEKSKEYKNLIRRNISTEQLEELDKCVLLCRQCHGVIHAQNIKGTLEIKVNCDGKEISQKLEGQLILDNVDKELTFISNQKCLLAPYRVIVGSEKEKILCGVQLETEGLLAALLNKIEKHKIIEIYSINGKRLLMKAEHVKGREVKLTQTVDFPIFTIELSESKGGKPYLWVRNGLMLNKDGSIQSKGVLNYKMVLK